MWAINIAKVWPDLAADGQASPAGRIEKPPRKATNSRAVRKRRRSFLLSRILAMILVSNLLALAFLAIGALLLNEMRAGLVSARLDGLRLQADLISSLVASQASVGEPQPSLRANDAVGIMRNFRFSDSVRARIFDTNRTTIADSDLILDRVQTRALPSLDDKNVSVAVRIARMWNNSLARIRNWGLRRSGVRALQSLNQELDQAFAGEAIAGERVDNSGMRIASVSVPIQHVLAVVGVLTIEADDIDAIIAAERISLVPFIAIASLLSLLSSAALGFILARPMRELADAAENVRSGAEQTFRAEKIARRPDEIGELARSLRAMTRALSRRIDENERMGADVAHELKNPLWSIKSAVARIRQTPDESEKADLLQVIELDVRRADCLITDIANASRVGADIARTPQEKFDINELIHTLAYAYDATLQAGDAEVAIEPDSAERPIYVLGQPDSIGQVFRNLIDNARSFSPPAGVVRIRLDRMERGGVSEAGARRPNADGRAAPRSIVRIRVEDNGPGIPPDDLEKIFERFYSDRPEGQNRARNSGLGLSIAREIVMAHRGRIWAENQREYEAGRANGARLIVELPIEA